MKYFVLIFTFFLNLSRVFADDELYCYTGTNPSDLSQRQASSSQACMSYRHFCTDVMDICTQEEVDSKTTKSVADVVSSDQCSRMMKQKDKYEDMVCCYSQLCNPPSFMHIDQQTADLNGDGMISCYSSVPGGENKVKLENAQRGSSCFIYMKKCTESDDEDCSPDEILHGQEIEIVGIGSSSFCLDLLDNPLKKHAKCCTADLCNAPSSLNKKDAMEALIRNGINVHAYAASAGAASIDGYHAQEDKQAKARVEARFNKDSIQKIQKENRNVDFDDPIPDGMVGYEGNVAYLVDNQASNATNLADVKNNSSVVEISLSSLLLVVLAALYSSC